MVDVQVLVLEGHWLARSCPPTKLATKLATKCLTIRSAHQWKIPPQTRKRPSDNLAQLAETVNIGPGDGRIRREGAGELPFGSRRDVVPPSLFGTLSTEQKPAKEATCMPREDRAACVSAQHRF